MITYLLSTDHRLLGLDIAIWLSAVAPGLGPDLLEVVPVLRGVLVLSTRNRLTLPIDTGSWADTDCPAVLYPDLRLADASQSVAVSDLGETITVFLAGHAGLPASGLLLTHPVGVTVRREMLAIATGLSPVAVGKAQVAGQVRRTVETVAAEDMLNPEFMWAVRRVLATTCRMAHETEPSGQGRSVVTVGVDQTTGHLPLLGDRRVLAAGTGPYADVAVADLCARGLTDIVIYSISNRAEVLVAGCGLRVIPAGALNEAMSHVDLTIAYRDIGRPILIADVVAPVATGRTDSAKGAGRSLVILDLALTRGVDKAVGTLPGVVHLNLARMCDAMSDAEARQVAAVRTIAKAEAADFECTLAGRVMDPLITTLRTQVSRVVAEEVVHLCPQLIRRLALAVPAVNGRARTGVSGVSSADAAMEVCPHHHLATDPGFGIASKTDGELIVSLARAEQALYHPVVHLFHQPTVMIRCTGQEGYEGTYRQVLKLVWGLESTEENHG